MHQNLLLIQGSRRKGRSAFKALTVITRELYFSRLTFMNIRMAQSSITIESVKKTFDREYKRIPEVIGETYFFL